METANGFRNIVFIDHEGEVNLRGALGNHAHIDVAEGGEYACGNARGAANIFSYEANNGFAALVFDVGDFGEVGREIRNRFVGIYGERNTDFRGGNDVHGTTVPVKSVENCFQNSVCAKHARGDYIHDGDPLLRSNGLECVPATGGVGDNARAFAFRVARIEHIHRDVLLNGGEQRGGMQHLGAEVGELGSLFEADDLDAARVRAEAWVGGHHAVHVGPDFDALGVQRGAHNGRGKIRSAPAHGGRDAIACRANESAHHGYQIFRQQRFHFCLQARIRDVEHGDGASVSRVGDDALARVHQIGINAARGERLRDNLAGEALTEGEHVVGGTGSQLAYRGDSAQQFIERVKFGFQLGVKLREDAGSKQFTGGVVMAFAHGAGELECAVALT